MVALGETLYRNDTKARGYQNCCRQFAQSAKTPVRSTADIFSGRCRRDKCGAIVEAYDTDAYGSTLIFTGPGADGIWFTDDDVQSDYGANSIIYCGYRYDPETENYYVRNRCYSPALGRWVTRDPIGYRGGINPYEYVASGPMGNADASGQRRISFAFDAFINGNRRGRWLPEPLPYLWVQFRTDWRGFGQFNPHGGPKGFGNARLYSYGWVDSCDIGHLAEGDYSATTADGLSENRWKSDPHGDIGSGRARPHSFLSHYLRGQFAYGLGDGYGISISPVWVTVPYRVTNVSPTESKIYFAVYASFPLALFAPAIAYEVTFDFKRENPDSVEVTFSGKRTPFPDFEGYIAGNLIYQAESPHSGPGSDDLGVSKMTVNIPPVGVGVRG